MSASINKAWRQSTLSNYGLLMLRMLAMLVLTREMFLGLSPADYGFWALIWSIFGYSMLLDFGFGTALQKATAESLAQQQWGRYQRIVSSVLVVYLLMGVAMALGSWLLAPYVMSWFAGGQQSEYTRLFVLFGCGTALVFPTGFAAELLRGLQAIHTRNLIQGLVQLLQLGGSFWVLRQDLGLGALTLVTLGSSLLGNLLMLAMAWRYLPPLRLQWPEWPLLKEIGSFSAFAYLITLTNLLIFRSDQLVIGAYLGLAAVAGYQIANRLADLFRQLSTQMHDYLGPLAARQFAQGDGDALRSTLLTANRWIHLFAVPGFVLLAWHLPDILRHWLKLEDPAVILSAYLLLASMFIQVTLRSSSTQILLMCQQQRTLAGLALLESLANLGLSIWLVQRLGIVGVALGTLIPNVLLSLMAYLPLTLKHAHSSPRAYWRQCVWPAYRAGLTMLGLYLPLTLWWPASSHWLQLLLSMAVMGTLGLLSTCFLALTAAEQQVIRQRLGFYRRQRQGYNKQHA